MEKDRRIGERSKGAGLRTGRARWHSDSPGHIDRAGRGLWRGVGGSICCTGEESTKRAQTAKTSLRVGGPKSKNKYHERREADVQLRAADYVTLERQLNATRSNATQRNATPCNAKQRASRRDKTDETRREHAVTRDVYVVEPPSVNLYQAMLSQS